MTTTPANTSRGYALALGSSIILAFTGILIRHITQTYQLPALVLAGWRNLFVALILIVAFIFFGPKYLSLPQRHWGFFGWYGLVLAGFNSLWTISVAFNGAAVATVLVYTSVSFTALFGWWFLKEEIGWVKISAILFSLGGCFLVAGGLDITSWETNPIGITTGLLSGLGYAGYSLMGRAASQRNISPWTTLLYAFGCAALILILINLLPGLQFPGKAIQPQNLFWLGRNWAAWGYLLLLAVGPTLFGFGLYNASLGQLPASIANLILTTEPIFTAVIAFVLLDEKLTIIQIFGSGLILVGVIFLRLKNGQRQERKL
jgi:drug/metabolite transporter (DMT)-like permease